jgi:glucan 1,3-beta-glucosidase
MQRAAVFAVAVLSALGALWYWVARGAEVALPDARAERLACVSYTPFRRAGQSPLVPGAFAGPAQIEADLALLARRARCVRTYSVDQGLAEVPRIARRYGLRVLLGLWIGRDRAENEREIERGLAVLRRDPGVIDAVIVGSEVLLRRELPAGELRRYLERVDAATAVPVTYADVWEFWLRNPELASAAALVTVHLLPYWEDEPIPVERAVDHAVRVHARVRAAFPGKEILVGEVGWPSRGRRREGAVPSLVNQARFVREFVGAAATHGLRYNVIEAFDQPWKRRLEGTVGGHWGVLDADGAEKFALRGPVVEDPEWARGVLAAALGAMAFALFFPGTRTRVRGVVLLALCGGGAGAALAAQLDFVAASSRDAFEWAIGAALTAAALAVTLLAAGSLARWIDGGAPRAAAPAAAIVAWLRTNASGYATDERWLGALRFALLFGAAVVALALVFDPRYRDFPIALAAPPAVCLAVHAWVAPAPAALEERVLGLVLGAAAPLIVLREGLANTDALAWSALSLALAASVWRGPAGGAREHQQAEEEPRGAGDDGVEHEPGSPAGDRTDRPA